MKQSQRVFVGLSGGVDSSVAAVRLLEAGYDVVGVFIKVWQPDWLNCNWEAERLDAMRVAAHLGIPFLTCDAEAAYKEDVADYFISEYLAGRTPNPDVMCNQAVKFGRFLDFSLERGADFIATGHYAQVRPGNTSPELWRGADRNKDQSYFLWTLNAKQLERVLLPVGGSSKDQIRKEAEARGLATATKPDSQGVCFLGAIDISEFIGHYTQLQSGAVLDTEGNVVGEQQGALIYTTGQRHGFTLKNSTANAGPQYVVARDIKANTITVSPTPPKTAVVKTLVLEDLNLIATDLTVGTQVEAQTRYRQTPGTYVVTQHTPMTLHLTPTAETESVSLGQSCVLYNGNQCLGGGIIAQVVDS